jgi:acetyltransferase-like isoleucine patch superfamily enzyme
VIGTNSVVTCDVPANAVMGGVPAKLIRMRDAPRTFRWE